MRKGKHFILEERKVIASGLSHDRTLIEMSELLGRDPTSISKEIKRHLSIISKGNPRSRIVCKRKNRFPFVCDNCPLKYSKKCDLEKTRYNPETANRVAKTTLTKSRNQRSFTEEQLSELNEKLFIAKENNSTVYHMAKSQLSFPISISSVYRLVNTNQLDYRRIDLPVAVKYRRKKVPKQYQYRENNYIDRSRRTYLDFLEYKKQHPGETPIQMDYLGAITTDKKNIFVIRIPEVQFSMLFLTRKHDGKQIIKIFNKLEECLEQSFSYIIPFILTDRDTAFSLFEEFESNPHSGEIRTRIFYCDPMASWQKANVENINKQIRKYFRKKESVDHLAQNDVYKKNLQINSEVLRSLSGYAPSDAFARVYGHKNLNIIHDFIKNFK